MQYFHAVCMYYFHICANFRNEPRMYSPYHRHISDGKHKMTFETWQHTNRLLNMEHVMLDEPLPPLLSNWEISKT